MNKFIFLLAFSFLAHKAISENALTAIVTHPQLINECLGGAIDLSINKGIPPYDMVWVDENETPIKAIYGIPGKNGQEDLFNLGVGYYKALVTDSHCGKAYIEFNLTCECPDGCFGVKAKTNLTACLKSENNYSNNCDGSIVLHFPSKQFDIESYAWTGPNSFTSETKDLFGLCDPGIYNVTITYNGGKTYNINNINICRCDTESESDKYTYNLNNFGLIKTSAEIYPHNISSLGSIKLSTTGCYVVSDILMNNYTYNWSGPNGFTGASDFITGLLPGKYTVAITDGCSQIDESFEVIDCNGQIDIKANVTDVCGSWQNGSIELYSPSSDISNFSFRWYNGGISNKIQNRRTGKYYVTITDNVTNCKRRDSYEITYKATQPFEVNAKIIEGKEGEGSISLSPKNPKQILTYEWENGNNNNAIFGLGKGTYKVRITNRSGCAIEKQYNLDYFGEQYLDFDDKDSEVKFNDWSTDQIAEIISLYENYNSRPILPLEIKNQIVKEKIVEQLKVKPNDKNKIKVYPNPFIENIIVEFLAVRSGFYQFRVIDNYGKIVFDKSINCNKGIFKCQLGLEKLNHGVHFLEIFNFDNKKKVGNSRIIKL